MEYLDEVNKENDLTGRALPKEDFHKNGNFYREVICFVMNEKQEVLMQRRSANKKDKPNMWEICYGHISSGETPNKAIIRELKEEINLEIEEKELIKLGIEKTEEINNNRYHNAFSYIYLVKTNKEISDFKMQKEEVSALKYVALKKLKEMLKNNDNTIAFSNFKFIPKIIDKIENGDKN